MPIVLLMPLIIFLIIALFGVLIITFFSAKGLSKLVKIFRQISGQSYLPRSIKQSLQESRYFGRLIIQTVEQYPPSPMRDRLNRALQPVDDWLANLTRLEQGLSKLYVQRNLGREIRHAKFEIEALRRQSLTASKAEVATIRELVTSKKAHLATLKELQAFQTQAELKIRKIATDLGATHAEILLIAAKGDFNHNRLHRLDENLQEHVTGMRDILAAMDELGYTSAAS